VQRKGWRGGGVTARVYICVYVYGREREREKKEKGREEETRTTANTPVEQSNSMVSSVTNDLKKDTCTNHLKISSQSNVSA